MQFIRPGRETNSWRRMTRTSLSSRNRPLISACRSRYVPAQRSSHYSTRVRGLLLFLVFNQYIHVHKSNENNDRQQSSQEKGRNWSHKSFGAIFVYCATVNVHIQWWMDFYWFLRGELVTNCRNQTIDELISLAKKASRSSYCLDNLTPVMRADPLLLICYVLCAIMVIRQQEKEKRGSTRQIKHHTHARIEQ